MMNSSEIQDSRKFSGHRSNFSQTCNLLSQYLKEKRSVGDLNLALMSPNFQQHGGLPSPTGRTKDLLPMIEKTNQKTVPEPVQPERAQMTIFYGGQVIVLNDLPADKAKEIMGLASQKSTTMVHKPAESAPLPPPATSNAVHGAWNNLVKEHPKIPTQPLSNDLPIMRNASLARFLGKRKDRITAKAPYQTRNTNGTGDSSDSGSKHAVENKTWLGLAAAQSSSHQPIHRQL